MSLSANVSLIVATLDLKLVQLLRGAIRAADAGAAASAGGSSATPAATHEPRRHIHPEPLIEPRSHVHPTPLVDARPVRCLAGPRPEVVCVPVPVAPVEHCHDKSPIQPPWKVLPWENPPQPVRRVKLVMRRPDNVTKGSLLDLFM